MLPHGITLEDARKRIVTQCLDRHDGNRTRTARELGINVKTLYNWMQKKT